MMRRLIRAVVWSSPSFARTLRAPGSAAALSRSSIRIVPAQTRARPKAKRRASRTPASICRPAYRRSGDADRRTRRTRATNDRQRGEAVDELIFLVGDQIVEEQILMIEDPVLGLQRHMHGKGQRLVRIGNDLHGPGIGAG